MHTRAQQDEEKELNELSTGQLLFRTAKLARKRMRVHFERLGLHRGQGFILWRLYQRDGIPQGELARGLSVTAATVSGALQRMEEAGWIERRHDAKDQRVSRVFLTPRGRSVHEELSRAFRELEDELLAGFSPEDEAALRSLVLRLHGNLLKGKRDEGPCGT